MTQSGHVTGTLEGSDPAVLAAFGERGRARLGTVPGVTPIVSPVLEMYAVKDFLSAAECAELVALIDAGVKPSTGPRTGETCRLYPDHPVVAEVDRRIAGLLGLPPENGEPLQGQRYLPGQQDMEHHDFFLPARHYSAGVAAEGGQRTWTAMAYLGQPGAGGQTHFTRLGLRVPPRRGVLLIWNNLDREGGPNLYSIHATMSVEAGIKHVLTKWFRERPWTRTVESEALRQ